MSSIRIVLYAVLLINLLQLDQTFRQFADRSGSDGWSIVSRRYTSSDTGDRKPPQDHHHSYYVESEEAKEEKTEGDTTSGVYFTAERRHSTYRFADIITINSKYTGRPACGSQNSWRAQTIDTVVIVV